MEFKVGDKVKCVKSVWNNQTMVGLTGVVIEVDFKLRYGYRVEYKEKIKDFPDNNKKYNTWWHYENELELVEDEKLKVGDRVEVIENHSSSGPNKGQRGTIRFIDDRFTTNVPYAVEFDESFIGGHCCGYSIMNIPHTCKDKRGWWCADKEDAITMIKKIEDEELKTESPCSTVAVKLENKNDLDIRKLIYDALERPDKTVHIFSSSLGVQIDIRPDTPDEEPYWKREKVSGLFECSSCGILSADKTPYCFHCGEQMRMSPKSKGEDDVKDR